MVKRNLTKFAVFLIAIIMVGCLFVGCENNVSAEVDNINDLSTQLGLGSNTIKLLSDISAPEIELVSSNLSTLDLNGKTLTVKSFKINSAKEGLMTVSNGTIAVSGDIIFDTPNATLTLDKFVGTIGNGFKARLNGSKNTVNLTDGFKVTYGGGETAPLEIPGNTRVVIAETVTNGLILNVVGGDVIIDNKSAAQDNKIVIAESVSGSVEISNSGSLNTVENKSENANVKVSNSETATKPNTVGKVEVVGSYTVVFNTDGGSIVNNISVNKGDAISVAPVSERYGYNFLGWFKNAEFTEEITFPFTPSEDITVFAKWEELPKYIVMFDLNGGILEGANLSYTVYKGDNIVDIGIPTKANHTFKGWTPELNLTNIQANATYTATWEELPKFTITFDLNGGTFADGESFTQTIYKGSNAETPSNPTKDGCTFDGWEPILNLDNIQADATYTAKWINIPSYTITFDLDGGIFANGESLTQTVLKGGNAVTPGDPTKLNYEFKGWSPALNLTNIQANAAYTATWEELPKFTITFDLEGGSFGDGESLTQTIYKGANGTAPSDPTKLNYEFKGWSPALNLTNIQANATYTATWEELPKYTITFDLAGGSFADGESLTQTIYKGANGTVPSDPTKLNYEFKGWSPALNLTNVQANATYTATWEAVASYIGKYYKLNQDYKYLAMEIFADGTAVVYNFSSIMDGQTISGNYGQLAAYKYNYEKESKYLKFNFQDIIDNSRYVSVPMHAKMEQLKAEFNEAENILLINYNSFFSGHYQKVTDEKAVNIFCSDKIKSTIYFNNEITLSERFFGLELETAFSDGYLSIFLDTEGNNIYKFDKITDNKNLYVLPKIDKTIDITQFYGDYMLILPPEMTDEIPEYDNSQTGLQISLFNVAEGIYLNDIYGYSRGYFDDNGVKAAATIVSVYTVPFMITNIYFCDDGRIYFDGSNIDFLPNMPLTKINNEEYCKVTILDPNDDMVSFANKKDMPLNEMFVYGIFGGTPPTLYYQDNTVYNYENITEDVMLIAVFEGIEEPTVPEAIKILFGNSSYKSFKSERFYLELNYRDNSKFNLRYDDFWEGNNGFNLDGTFTVEKEGTFNLKIILTSIDKTVIEIIYNIQTKQMTAHFENQSVIFYSEMDDNLIVNKYNGSYSYFIPTPEKRSYINFDYFGFYYFTDEVKDNDGNWTWHRELGRYTLVKAEGTTFYNLVLQKYNGAGYEDSAMEIAYNWYEGFVIITGKGEYYSEFSNIAHPAVGQYYFTDVDYGPFTIDRFGFVYYHTYDTALTSSNLMYLGRLVTVYNDDYSIKGFNVGSKFISYNVKKQEGVYKGRTFKKSPFEAVHNLLGLNFYAQDGSGNIINFYPFGKVVVKGEVNSVGTFSIAWEGTGSDYGKFTLNLIFNGQTINAKYDFSYTINITYEGTNYIFTLDEPAATVNGVDYFYGEYRNTIDNIADIYLYLDFDRFYLKIISDNLLDKVLEVYGYIYVEGTKRLHLIGENVDVVISANYLREYYGDGKIEKVERAKLVFDYNGISYSVYKDVTPSESPDYLFDDLVNRCQGSWNNESNYLNINYDGNTLIFDLFLSGFEKENFRGIGTILGANESFIYLELKAETGTSFYVNIDIRNNRMVLSTKISHVYQVYAFYNGQIEVPFDIQGKYYADNVAEMNIKNDGRFFLAIYGEVPANFEGKIEYWFTGAFNNIYMFKFNYNLDGIDKICNGVFDVNSQTLTFNFEGVDYSLNKEYVAPPNEFDGFYSCDADFISIDRDTFLGYLGGTNYSGSVGTISNENDNIFFNLIQDGITLDCVFNRQTRDLTISLNQTVIAEFINYPFKNFYQDNNGNYVQIDNLFNATFNNQNYNGKITEIVKTEQGYDFKLFDESQNVEFNCIFSNNGDLKVMNDGLGISIIFSNKKPEQDRPFVGSYSDKDQNILNLFIDGFDGSINGKSYKGYLSILEEKEKEYFLLALSDKDQGIEFTCRFTYDGMLTVENKTLGINLQLLKQQPQQDQPFVGGYYDNNKNNLNLYNDNFDEIINGTDYKGILSVIQDDKDFIVINITDKDKKVEFICTFTFSDKTLTVENKELGISLTLIKN